MKGTASMEQKVLKLSGNRDSIERLRSELLAEPKASSIRLRDVGPDSDSEVPRDSRARQFEIADAIVAFLIEVPAGITAHMAYDWLREWLKERAATAQVRVKEVKSSDQPN